MTRQDKSKSRVTPKGTVPEGQTPSRTGVDHRAANIPGPSPKAVPIVMFTALVSGTVLILANYVMPNNYLGMPSNWYLLGGLGLILLGIIAATQYR